MDANQLCIV